MDGFTATMMMTEEPEPYLSTRLCEEPGEMTSCKERNLEPSLPFQFLPCCGQKRAPTTVIVKPAILVEQRTFNFLTVAKPVKLVGLHSQQTPW